MAVNMACYSVPRAEQVAQILRYACCAKSDTPTPHVDAEHHMRVKVGRKYEIPVAMFRPRGQKKLVISIQGTNFSQYFQVYLDAKLAISEFLEEGFHERVVRRICNHILSELEKHPKLLEGATAIEVVGHSLGGYIAQHLSIFGGLHRYKVPLRCWAIDSPGLLPSDLEKLAPDQKKAIKGRHFAILSYPNIVNTLGSHECNVVLQVAHLTEDPEDMDFDSSTDDDNDSYYSSDSDSEGWDFFQEIGRAVRCRVNNIKEELKEFVYDVFGEVIDGVKEKVAGIGTMALMLGAFFKRLHCHRLTEFLQAAEAREIWHMHQWPQLMDSEHPFDEFKKMLELMFEDSLPYKYIKTYVFHREEFDYHPLLTLFSRNMLNYEPCHQCHGEINRALHYHERLRIPRVISSRLSTSKCVDVCEAGGEGSEVLVWDRHGGNNQKWLLEEVDRGVYRLIPCHNQNVCLSGLSSSALCGRKRDVCRLARRGGLHVTVESKTDADDIPEWHLWRMEPVAGGFHRLKCVFNNQYLAVSENSTRNTRLILWGHVLEWGQHWKVEYAQ